MRKTFGVFVAIGALIWCPGGSTLAAQGAEQVTVEVTGLPPGSLLEVALSAGNLIKNDPAVTVGQDGGLSTLFDLANRGKPASEVSEPQQLYAYLDQCQDPPLLPDCHVIASRLPSGDRRGRASAGRDGSNSRTVAPSRVTSTAAASPAPSVSRGWIASRPLRDTLTEPATSESCTGSPVKDRDETAYGAAQIPSFVPHCAYTTCLLGA